MCFDGWKLIFECEFWSYFVFFFGYVFVVIFFVVSGFFMVLCDFGCFFELW